MSSAPSFPRMIDARHIQNFSDASSLEPHWGYAERVVPCTNDPGSCAYLDVVYGAHDVGMIYVGAFWAAVLGLLFGWFALRRVGLPTSSLGINTEEDSSSSLGGLVKVRRAIAASLRSYLLPDAFRAVFGRTTRYQVFILAVLTVYLTIFSFVGMTYNTWITPVKNMPGVYNTRTTLGPWSDRIGVLAYALTPLSVLLSSRESILSLITGVPYQSFNFLHRWVGYIILAQSILHTIGWCVIEIRLYQPQPTVAVEWITQVYMIWGIVAMILLLLLFGLSTPWGIRLTGYEFFRKAHYVLAMIFIGACWAHWEALKCFMIPSLIFWFMDRGARFIRTALLHYQYLPSGGMGFKAAQATVTLFPDAEAGDVVRLDFDHEQDPWAIGQHYYLTFSKLSIWQSHPFTPLNAPTVQGGRVKHSYLLRAKGGETKKLANLAVTQSQGADNAIVTPVIATGAYGENIMSGITADTNIICVAGGTGITYVLPVLLQLARSAIIPDRKIELIWAVRHASNVEWIQEEMDLLHKVQRALNLTIRLYATRDIGTGSSKSSISGQTNEKAVSKVSADEVASASSRDEEACDCGEDVPVKKTGAGAVDEERHPNLTKLVNDFVGSTIRGPTSVIASGPGGMISDLRSIVAACNSGSKVWNGEERFDVDLMCDDRLEW
ncbi:Ferric/cupric reductase transmembrane component 2 [Paramyrothecium foliicola]|nr:Ferric/cupric reductase transmembrane component 2 [Paramyrothecium foliicola]